MSASLVGSEMCIRDSARARLATAPALVVSQVGYAISFLWGSRGARINNCLLYTSDAADDM
eukprot:14113675-Alexandrium_andersonii.AAC.1